MIYIAQALKNFIRLTISLYFIFQNLMKYMKKAELFQIIFYLLTFSYTRNNR